MVHAQQNRALNSDSVVVIHLDSFLDLVGNRVHSVIHVPGARLLCQFQNFRGRGNGMRDPFFPVSVFSHGLKQSFLVIYVLFQGIINYEHQVRACVHIRQHVFDRACPMFPAAEVRHAAGITVEPASA